MANANSVRSRPAAFPGTWPAPLPIANPAAIENNELMKSKGFHAAILSAFLFGLSPVACKALVGPMSPALLAGLLYLGSGLGLTGLVLRQRLDVGAILASLSRWQWGTLAGAILSGGVAAPLFLAYGILHGTAAEVSLLLNFEAVATTLLAWLIFHEHVGPRVWIGKVFIVGASLLVVVAGSGVIRLSIPGMCVLVACLLWGVDNNLTRELEDLSPVLLACLKGWCAGLFNLLLALVLFRSLAAPFQVAGALAIGALSYGASLVLFIQALREIGSARTSTWFASGPFLGTLLAVVVLGERPPMVFWAGVVVMLLGMFFLYGERHRHLHRHEQLAHSHPHSHDEHHRHSHPATEIESAGVHDHFHEHEVLEHSHVHWPDIHHRHGH
jgi:drug/metabolite transporter (DMT)-like permease